MVDIVIHHHYKSFSRTVDENHQLWLLAPLGNVVPSFDTGLIKIKDGLCATIKLGLDLRSHLKRKIMLEHNGVIRFVWIVEDM